MRHVGHIAGRELRSLFVSPVAYGVLSLFSVLASVFFLLDLSWFHELAGRFQQYQQYDQQLNLNEHLIAEFYGSISVILLFMIPAITMGLFAAEKTNGTEELLLTSPVTAWDIVFGKLLGAGFFVSILIGIVGLFPGLLFIYGDPEVGRTLSGLLGLMLVGWMYVAIGAFASSITRSQIIAFLISLVLLLVILLLPAVADLGVAAGAPWVGDVCRYLSANAHLEELVKGIVDTADLAYFAVMIACFALMTKASVESARWR
jgi:ABC-2 type transport system permease protein